MDIRLKDRRLIQVAFGYLAGGWLCLEAVKELGDQYGWPDWVFDVTLTLVLAGFLAALVIGWFHGEKGRQEVPRIELALLTAIAVVGLSGAVVVASATSSVSISAGSSPASGLDSAKYVVFPFPGSGSMLEETSPDLLLYDALRRWGGIEVVHPFRALQAEEAGSPGAHGFSAYRQRAAELGASRFVTGDIRRVGAAGRLSAALFETTGGEQPIADTAVRWEEPGVPGPELYRRVADALLFRSAGAKVEPDVEPATLSYAAHLAFLEGLDATSQWNLRRAEARFGEAGRLDPEYARAHLWRAQVMNWDDRRGTEVLGLLERAVVGRATLTARERLMLDGLLGLERKDFPASCAAYRALRDANPQDFAAHFGLGQCGQRDRMVVADPGSPSGWRFRSSGHRYLEAYRRAFELLPAVHRGFATRTFSDLGIILMTGRQNVRYGHTPGPDPVDVAAYSGLEGDTLSFVPYPIPELQNPESRPASHDAAVHQQRQVFHGITQRWVSSYPDSPDALEAYALALDMLGDPAALDTLRSARDLANDDARDRRLAIKEIFLIVKYSTPFEIEELRRAVSLADSLLGLTPAAGDLESLAAVAALSGRVYQTARYAARAAKPIAYFVEVPVAVSAPVRALLAYASMGGPADSLHRYERLVLGGIRNVVPPDQQQPTIQHLLERPAMLAAPAYPLEATQRLAEGARHPTLRAQAALLQGRTDRAGEILRTTYASNRVPGAANRTPDLVYPEAWVAVATGDTAMATAALDSMLNSIRWLDPGTLDDYARAGALIHGMAYRADLAQAVGDPETAAGWGAVVSTLWTHADEPLRPLVSRMRELAEQAIVYPTATEGRPPHP